MSGDGQHLVEDEVAQIAHDLKSPISAIALEATLLEQWLGAREQIRAERSVTRIHDNITFLDRLVHDLLDVCALAAGTLTLLRAPVELGGLIERVTERVAGASRNRVTIEAPAPIVVNVDEVRIQRVVANLLDNALRYSADSAPVVIRLAATDLHARVSVRDAGPGIPSAELPHVFDRYQRGTSIGNRVGCGLGLYTCKRIIEAHGGRIGAESVRHIGTRFYFEVPR